MQDIRQASWFDQLLERLPEQVSFALLIIGCLLLAQVVWTHFPDEPERKQDSKTASIEMQDNNALASSTDSNGVGKPTQR